MDDIELAIRILGKSAWYQRGEFEAESLMNVLERIALNQIDVNKAQPIPKRLLKRMNKVCDAADKNEI